jgi:hypothetical protein
LLIKHSHAKWKHFASIVVSGRCEVDGAIKHGDGKAAPVLVVNDIEQSRFENLLQAVSVDVQLAHMQKAGFKWISSSSARAMDSDL